MRKQIGVARMFVPAALALSASMSPASAGDILAWQTNEVQYQYGELDLITAAGGGSQSVSTLTLQHADGWAYGDNFFFADLTDNERTDNDVYSEGYANFSLGKISGKELKFGPVQDVGVIAGYNYAREAKVQKWLPGMRLSWAVPGFAFLNTDFMAYLDDSSGVAAGGAPKEDDSWLFDVSWALPLKESDHRFSIEGHAEYAADRRNEFGEEVAAHLLAQIQFRYDLGQTWFQQADRLFAGIEYQYWRNKLGDPAVDESAVQLLLVWRL